MLTPTRRSLEPRALEPLVGVLLVVASGRGESAAGGSALCLPRRRDEAASIQPAGRAPEGGGSAQGPCGLHRATLSLPKNVAAPRTVGWTRHPRGSGQRRVPKTMNSCPWAPTQTPEFQDDLLDWAGLRPQPRKARAQSAHTLRTVPGYPMPPSSQSSVSGRGCPPQRPVRGTLRS